MTLRLRLVISLGVLALLVAALYGTLVFTLFQRQQWAQLEAILARELGRMEGVLSDPRVGVPLFVPERSGTVVQLVTEDGRVVLPRGDVEPLPAGPEPGVVELGSGYYLSAMQSLRGGNSVRVGLEVTDEVTGRSLLARQLIWLGVLIALLSALLGGLLASRTLSPLSGLARQARRVDPANPEPVAYTGPRDEVAEVASALNATIGNIRLRRDEERAFLSEVAHELAAPLTLVKGHIDALKRRNGSETSRAEHLSAANSAAEELLLTSQDLLSLARGELDRALKNEVVKLDELLQRLEIAYPGVRVDAQPVKVVGDSHQLLQAIRNLVRNAVQATGTAEGVTLALREREGRAELQVRDQGPGIPPERMERIFERFFSGSSGAGVGLTVVSRIIEQHGGELKVDSGADGSTFTIVLPSFRAQLTTSA